MDLHLKEIIIFSDGGDIMGIATQNEKKKCTAVTISNAGLPQQRQTEQRICSEHSWPGKNISHCPYI